jgi:outer membrane protein assembly factor BamD
MGAFSYYLNQDYSEAIAVGAALPRGPSGQPRRALCLLSDRLSYYEQISDVTRDQKITQQALDSLGELTRRYPNTKYAADARLKIDLVRDHLAGKEMEIGRFYETPRPVARRDDPLPQRGRQLPDDDPRARGADAADRDLSRARRAEEAQKAAAVLGANYPGTDWYERAYKLMQKNQDKAVAQATPGQDGAH